jgi:hypothetical protein
VLETRQIAPGPGLPAAYDAVGGNSNNNLDVVRHEGRVYFASRKAPTHFASVETRLFVFSSMDEQGWALEATIALGTDVREPRFLSLGGRLFLYFAKLGQSAGGFNPAGMLFIERRADGSWSDPAPFFESDVPWIPWRVVVHDGVAYMTAYEDGAHIYDFSGTPLRVSLLRSTDGVTWSHTDPARPAVSTGGGSEAGFAFDRRGDLYAVIRNEAGDGTGWGSKICRAAAGSLGDWRCAHDPKKYDSPLVFELNDVVYLIGRRNVSDTGDYELTPGLQRWSSSETIANQADYWVRPKRCSLWQLDRPNLKVTWLADLPGWGDTCFASILDDPADPELKLVYNYSSPLDNPANADLPWMRAQEGETRIYRSVVRFPRTAR